MRRMLIGALALAVLAWLLLRAQRERAVPPPSPVVHSDTASTGLRTVRLWFASADGDSLVPESRDLEEAGSLHERVAALVAELARGPRRGGMSTLPPGTALVHVFLDDRGLMTLDLSPAFASGFRGGASQEYLSVASLIRTIATNLPEVKRLLVVCGGVPIASLGGHLPLDRPIDVSDWP